MIIMNGTSTNDHNITPLTVGNFKNLQQEDKLAYLARISPEERMNLIIEDPDGKKLAARLTPIDFYTMLIISGPADLTSMLQFASKDQFNFALDLELWEKWEFRDAQVGRWLEILLAFEDEEIVRRTLQIDPELLQLILLTQIDVGGGSGELVTDGERMDEWDHTFDDFYFIRFKIDDTATLVGTFLDILFRMHQPLYFSLMEGCRAALRSEFEELCYQFRAARMADLGFPTFEEAIDIYSPIRPQFVATVSESNDMATGITKHWSNSGNSEKSLFERVMEKTDPDRMLQELNHLINSAIIADCGSMADVEALNILKNRVYGRINISLEYLSNSHEESAIAIISTEPLKQLFRIGCGIIGEVATLAKGVTSDNYPTAKALRGFSAQRPIFYRGLDSDLSDGYREFKDMNDVRIVTEFIRAITS